MESRINIAGQMQPHKPVSAAAKAKRGIYEADELIELASRNRAPKLKGEALVVGRGDAALDAALTALDCGSQAVTVVSPEPRGHATTTAEKETAAKEAGVRLVYGWGLSDIDVYTDGLVSGAIFKRCTRAFDEDGAFSPVYDSSNTMAQYCDTLILAR